MLFVTAEAAPFMKVGGLGSVMEALPKALNEIGCDARVMLPKYSPIEENFNLSVARKDINVPTGNINGPANLVCGVKKYNPVDKQGAVIAYFLENQEYYELRSNVYGYADDPIRWALLSRGVIEFLRSYDEWKPDVIVACDWQTAPLLYYLKTEYRNDSLVNKIATVFSIHNLYYQGIFDHRYVQEIDIDDGHSPLPAFESDRLPKINSMRRGIMYADMITTVSENYAREILTPNYGELLDNLLRERRSVLTGILNGIDYSIWNPRTNPHIPHPYSLHNIAKKTENKTVLQERLGLKKDKDAFLMCIVSRLSKQKGFELLYPIVDTIMQELSTQLVVVGSGDSDLMGFFRDLELRYPGRVATHLSFDSVLPYPVLAGSDAILVPSQFEPCGLVQMEAMRMGTIPIVRFIGGLADTVSDYNPTDESGTGFTFEKYDSTSLMIAIIRAYENYRNKKDWQKIIKRGMEKDYSWKKSAEKYLDVFDRAKEIHKRELLKINKIINKK